MSAYYTQYIEMFGKINEVISLLFWAGMLTGLVWVALPVVMPNRKSWMDASYFVSFIAVILGLMVFVGMNMQ